MSEWITTAEAAELLKVSQRHVRELIRQKKLKAKRDGKNWLVHQSLSSGDAEVDEPPQGIPTEAYRRLEEEVGFLRGQVKEKDKALEDARKAAEEAGQRHDTIVLQLTRQVEQSQRLLEHHQEPWYRRWFRKSGKSQEG